MRRDFCGLVRSQFSGFASGSRVSGLFPTRRALMADARAPGLCCSCRCKPQRRRASTAEPARSVEPFHLPSARSMVATRLEYSDWPAGGLRTASSTMLARQHTKPQARECRAGEVHRLRPDLWRLWCETHCTGTGALYRMSLIDCVRLRVERSSGSERCSSGRADARGSPLRDMA